MRLTRIDLEHFRSVGKASLPVGRMCALVGANGAGKSNILRAVSFLLGERAPYGAALSREDFYGHDLSKPVVITLVFSNLTDDEQTFFTRPRHNVMRHPPGGGRPYVAFRFVGRGQDDFDFGFADIDKPKSDVLTYPAGGIIRVGNDDRERVRCVVLDAARLSDAFRTAPSSLFGQLLAQVNALLSDAERAEIATAMGEARDRIRQANAFSKLQADLTAGASDLVAPGEEGLSLSLTPFDTMDLLRGLQLMIDDGLVAPLREKGRGMQARMVVALLRAFVARRGLPVLFAVEEPEVFLHPHVRRRLVHVLRELARAGHQVLYSTHDPILVAHIDPSELRVVRRTRAGGTTVKWIDENSLTPRVTKRIAEDLNPHRAEMFFADRAILVEGKAEVEALSAASSVLEIDPNLRGVSVVECGSKTNLEDYSSLLSSLGIDHLAVYDTDGAPAPALRTHHVVKHDPRLEDEFIRERTVAQVLIDLAQTGDIGRYQSRRQQSSWRDQDEAVVLAAFMHDNPSMLARVIRECGEQAVPKGLRECFAFCEAEPGSRAPAQSTATDQDEELPF